MYKLVAVLLLNLLCSSFVLAGRVTAELDEMPPAYWQGYVIIVGYIARIEYPLTKVRVDRVLHGLSTPAGTITNISIDTWGEQIEPGEYILILQHDGDNLAWGYNNLSLGPLKNSLKVESATAPEVYDIQVIVDTARIALPGLKWQRLEELLLHMTDRPLVMQYVIKAQTIILNETQQRFNHILAHILRNYPDDASVVMAADEALISHGGEDGRQWAVSAERKALFNDLLIDIPEFVPAAPSVELAELPPEWYGYVIIAGHIARIEHPFTKVRVDRVLYGPPILAGAITDISIHANAQIDAGEHILILQYRGEELRCGYNNLSLGPLKNSLKVESATAPEIWDIQVIVDTALIALPGLKWQRLEELLLRMADRPLVMQYVIKAQTIILNETQQRFNHILAHILRNHTDYATSVAIAADEALISRAGEEGTQWAVSAERKALFNDLLIDTPKEDTLYSYIEETVRALRE